VPICENNTITIDAGAGFDSYLWSNGATTQTISVANPGDFSVTVTDDYDTISCSSTKNFTVKKSNKATINTIETKDWTDNDNVITVFATGNGDYEYSIDGFNYQASNQFTGLISGKYTVQVRDKNGCGTATNEVYLLMFQRFFTPNGDGYNDTWKIKFSDIEAGLTVKIFDRYGKIIKILSTNADSWDGTYNGTELSATDYWFVVTRANGIEYKGHFSLKR
jgi:gliding motility-associated-like protein